jgi:hypothetical protein
MRTRKVNTSLFRYKVYNRRRSCERLEITKSKVGIDSNRSVSGRTLPPLLRHRLPVMSLVLAVGFSSLLTSRRSEVLVTSETCFFVVVVNGRWVSLRLEERQGG